MNTQKIETAARKFATDIADLVRIEVLAVLGGAFVAEAPRFGPPAIKKKAQRPVRDLPATEHPTTMLRLKQAGAVGAKLADVAKGREKDTVKKELQALKDGGSVVVRGNTRGARWYLKALAPAAV